MSLHQKLNKGLIKTKNFSCANLYFINFPTVKAVLITDIFHGWCPATSVFTPWGEGASFSLGWLPFQ